MSLIVKDSTEIEAMALILKVYANVIALNVDDFDEAFLKAKPYLSHFELPEDELEECLQQMAVEFIDYKEDLLANNNLEKELD